MIAVKVIIILNVIVYTTKGAELNHPVEHSNFSQQFQQEILDISTPLWQDENVTQWLFIMVRTERYLQEAIYLFDEFDQGKYNNEALLRSHYTNRALQEVEHYKKL